VIRIKTKDGGDALKIANISNDDAFLNAPTVKMTPTCP